MKILQTTMASVILATLLGSSIAVADPANFDFYGCMQSIPNSNGGAFKMVGFLTNNGVVPTPIPFNWLGEEHTVVIEATYDNLTPPVTENYTGATVKIYTDVGPATAGDYANQATFSDFTLVLSGVINGFKRIDFPGNSSSYAGQVDWTGGTRLAELGANTTGFGIGGTGNTGSGNIPAGYADCWDGKIDQPVVAVGQETWGNVKLLFN
jgi:hypothetical protein